MESDAGSQFAPVLERLHQGVYETKQKIKDYTNQLVNSYTSQMGMTKVHYIRSLREKMNERRRMFRYSRTIFHPSETPVNIFFLMALTLKWVFFLMSFIECTITNFGPKSHLEDIIISLFAAQQILSTLITIVEIVLYLHVGYVDPETGRVIMDPHRVYCYYLKSKSKFPIDVISLVPVWITSIAYDGFRGDTVSRDDLTWVENLMHRLQRALPLCTILLQLVRSMELFGKPPQAQPFDSRVVSFKYIIKVLLSLFSIFW